MVSHNVSINLFKQVENFAQWTLTFFCAWHKWCQNNFLNNSIFDAVKLTVPNNSNNWRCEIIDGDIIICSAKLSLVLILDYPWIFFVISRLSPAGKLSLLWRCCSNWIAILVLSERVTSQKRVLFTKSQSFTQTRCRIVAKRILGLIIWLASILKHFCRY